MELELAVSATVGFGGAGGGEDLVAQPLNPAKMVDATPNPMLRNSVLFIPKRLISVSLVAFDSSDAEFADTVGA